MKTKLKYIIAILAAVVLPLSLANAQNYQFNNNPANTTSGSPEVIVGAVPGGSVTFSLQVVLPPGFATQAVDYWLIEASGPAGYPFSITNRDYTGSHFPGPGPINDPATMAPGNRLDPVNDVNLGSTVNDMTDRTNGTFQVANYTLSISADAAPGTYQIQTFDFAGFGINDVTPTAQAAINIEIIPEPATWSLIALGGMAAFGVNALRARSRRLS